MTQPAGDQAPIESESEDNQKSPHPLLGRDFNPTEQPTSTQSEMAESTLSDHQRTHNEGTQRAGGANMLPAYVGSAGLAPNPAGGANMLPAHIG